MISDIHSVLKAVQYLEDRGFKSPYRVSYNLLNGYIRGEEDVIKKNRLMNYYSELIKHEKENENG